MKSKNEPNPKKSQRNYSVLILAAGISLLIMGILLNLFSDRLFRTEKGDSPTAELETLKSSLSKYKSEVALEKPVFEADLIQIDLQRYQAMVSGTTGEISIEFLNYPVHHNEVASRIEKDSPPLKPNYGKMRTTDYFLKGFIKKYQRKKYKDPDVTVVCLVVKQVGKKRAEFVTLTMDRVELKEVRELYDATDMGIHGEGDSLRGSFSSVKKEQISLGSMDTASGIVIPLLITNYFTSIDDGEETLQVTSNVAFIPVSISFRETGSSADTTLPMKGLVSDPIIID
jgi:hypothetical protein